MNRQKIERISKALADENARAHFRGHQLLRSQELRRNYFHAWGDAGYGLSLSQNSEDADLIHCQRHGQFVHSKANPKALEDYTRVLSRLTRKKRRKK
jgi:hypothetical protein